jgi:hypothetical protein
MGNIHSLKSKVNEIKSTIIDIPGEKRVFNANTIIAALVRAPLYVRRRTNAVSYLLKSSDVTNV